MAGPGGNGGDGLFAGALLVAKGHPVSALLGQHYHKAAHAAFVAAGGEILTGDMVPEDTALLIDAIAGLGSARGVSGDALTLYRQAQGEALAVGGFNTQRIPVLAVDVPTGVDADTGAVARDAIQADVTVTFGWPRTAHALAPECGEVVVADLVLPGAPSFARYLEQTFAPAAYIAHEPTLPARFQWPEGDIALAEFLGGHGLSGTELDAQELGQATHPRPVGCTGPIADPTPGIRSDKYSGGVVTIAAGSHTYPGAGILSATAAVRTTPAMVRFIGDNSITALLPELVVHPDIAAAGRTQCIVVGPGRGTDENAAAELESILRTTARPQDGSAALPVVIDADALSLLAQHEHLRELVHAHPFTVLTPHEGEFARVYRAACGKELDPARGYAGYLSELATRLGSFVLLKGRITRITAPGQPIFAFDAGHSYSATPGSGDVLAGILGAVLAQRYARVEALRTEDVEVDGAKRGVSADETRVANIMEILHAGAIHAHAAALAARTPAGMGICSASSIAASIPEAVATLLAMAR